MADTKSDTASQNAKGGKSRIVSGTTQGVQVEEGGPKGGKEANPQ